MCFIFVRNNNCWGKNRWVNVSFSISKKKNKTKSKTKLWSVCLTPRKWKTTRNGILKKKSWGSQAGRRECKDSKVCILFRMNTLFSYMSTEKKKRMRKRLSHSQCLPSNRCNFYHFLFYKNMFFFYLFQPSNQRTNQPRILCTMHSFWWISNIKCSVFIQS